MFENKYIIPSDEIAELRHRLYKHEQEVSHLNELYEKARLKLIAEIEAEAESEEFRETIAEGYDACFDAVDELALELHEGVEDPLIPGQEGSKPTIQKWRNSWVVHTLQSSVPFWIGLPN
ncbi:hypothetical protein [Haladaptatus sp. NG-SE-30]